MGKDRRKINEYHKFCKMRGHVQIVEWWFNINYKGGMNRAHVYILTVYTLEYIISKHQRIVVT